VTAPLRPSRAPRGFTIVELAVVGAVVAILALVAFGTWRLFSERATEDVITLELRSSWQELRADAAAKGISPQAAADSTLRRLTTNSEFDYYLAAVPPSIVGWTRDRDQPLCARLVIPESPDVSAAPAGPCDHLTYTSMSRLDLAGWWPLTDGEGATTASTDNGPTAAAIGLTFGEPPAAVHAQETNEDHSARSAGGRLEFLDADGVTDASSGLTMGLWATTADPSTVLAQVGDGDDLTLGIDVDGQPYCTSGDAAATSQTPIVGSDWRLHACRLHPDGDVSLTVDGIERARDRRSDGAPPAWSSGTTVYPAGSPDGSLSGHVDHPFVASQPMSDGLLRALWGTSVAEMPDTP
jgi:prepilin-type N-terminal cleavage/methylation domain-containing protein